MSSTVDQSRPTPLDGAEPGPPSGPAGLRSTNPTRRRWLRRLVLAVVVGVVATLAIGWALLYSPWFTTTSVRVTGAAGLSEADVRAAAAVPEGEALLTLDTGAAAARVSALLEVERAQVSRSWPHTAVIDVVPRSAVAIASAGGGLDLVDRFGVRFASTPELPPDQPVLLAEDGEPMKAAVTVAAALPPQVRAQVAAIVVTGDQVRLRLREPGADGSADNSSQSSDGSGNTQVDVAKVASWQLSDGQLARIVNWGDASSSELKAKVLAAMLGAKGSAAASADGSAAGDGQEIAFRWFDVSSPDFPTAGASAPKAVADELTAAAQAQSSADQGTGGGAGGSGSSGQSSQENQNSGQSNATSDQSSSSGSGSSGSSNNSSGSDSSGGSGTTSPSGSSGGNQQ